MRSCRYWPRFLAALLFLTGLQAGCAFKYQDSAGRLHIVGLVAVTVKPATLPQEGAAAVETRNLGVMVYSSAATQGISVGYNTEQVIYPQRTVPAGTQDSSTPQNK